MTDRLPMTHPSLPGRTIWVRPAGVAARTKAGWQNASNTKHRPPETVPEPKTAKAAKGEGK